MNNLNLSEALLWRYNIKTLNHYNFLLMLYKIIDGGFTDHRKSRVTCMNTRNRSRGQGSGRHYITRPSTNVTEGEE